MEQARKDAQSGGQYSIDKSAQDYLKRSGLKDSSGKLLRQPNLTDVSVLASLGFQNIFGDPVIGIPALK
jgi:hypothetical protein